MKPGTFVSCCALFAFCAGPLYAQHGAHKVQHSAQLNDRGYLRIWNLVGNTRITGWDKDSVVVRGVAPDGQQLLCGGNATALKCAINGADESEDTARVTLDIMVPRHIQLWVKSATADVAIMNFDGNADVYSVSGAINVAGHAQSLTLESMAGRIVVPASATTLRARTASGDIRLSGTAEDVEATSVSGNLYVAPAALERGRFESIDGAVHWQGSLAAGASLEFGSHSGTIELRLPATASGDFTISSFAGSVRNDFGSARLVQGRDLNGRELRFTLRGDEQTRVVIRNFKGATVLLKY